MPFCGNCGTQCAETIRFCQKCGSSVSQGVSPQQVSTPQGRPTRAWYLVPFFLNIIGGIIGYFAVRNDDRSMANKLLIFGVVMFVIVMGLYALFMYALMFP